VSNAWISPHETNAELMTRNVWHRIHRGATWPFRVSIGGPADLNRQCAAEYGRPAGARFVDDKNPAGDRFGEFQVEPPSRHQGSRSRRLAGCPTSREE